MKKTIKAWTVLLNSRPYIPQAWGNALSIFEGKRQAQRFARKTSYPKNRKIVPCTITYTLPKKKR